MPLREIIRRITAESTTEEECLARTGRVIELSDEIAIINRRILERAKSGEPRDEKDHENLAGLMQELYGDAK